MGLLFSQKPSVSEKEFRRILTDMHNNFPERVRRELKALADQHIKEYGSEAGMDTKEVERFLEAAKVIVPSDYRGALDELRVRLEKAVKGSYGGF